MTASLVINAVMWKPGHHPQRTIRVCGLHLLCADGVLLLDAAVEVGTVGGAGGIRLVEVLGEGTVDLLFEDGFGLDGLELGLEVVEMVGVSGGVGAAAGVGHVEMEVVGFVTGLAPEERKVLAAELDDMTVQGMRDQNESGRCRRE